MGDHFVLLVDRLLTESTLEAAIESRNQEKQLVSATTDDGMAECASPNDSEAVSSPRKIVECRICQDEDVDSNMETPCSCCGSLKYAHRRCIQRWCNEKGNTVCEICHQQFKPGYRAPSPIFGLGGIPVNLRGNLGIVRRDLNNLHLLAMVSTDRDLLDPDYDEYAVSTSRNVMCCHTVAIIFMVLLVLRHGLPVIVSRAGHSSLTLVILLLRIAGIILPVYIILKGVTALFHRRRRQANLSVSPPDEEVTSLALHHQSHIVHVQ